MKNQTDQLANWLAGRQYWLNFMVDMRQILISTEIKAAAKISTDSHVRTDVGVWIDRLFIGAAPAEVANQPRAVGYAGGAGGPTDPTGGYEAVLLRNRNAARGMTQPPPGVEQAAAVETPKTNVVNILFRAVDLSSVSDPAKQNIVFTLESELKTCPLFDPAGIQFTDPILPDAMAGTFTFGIALPLKNPIEF